MVVPIYPSLGPLLATVANMFSELMAFAFPLVVVMIGKQRLLAACPSTIQEESLFALLGRGLKNVQDPCKPKGKEKVQDDGLLWFVLTTGPESHNCLRKCSDVSR